MFSRLLRFLVLVGLATIGIVHRGMAQDAPAPPWTGNTTGVQPYGTFDGVMENISLGTGDLNLSIPLLSLPGRHGLNLTVNLIYDSNIWSLLDTFVYQVNTHVLNWQKDLGVPPSLWRLSVPTLTFQYAFVGIFNTTQSAAYSPRTSC
jgi:hypothetical protein